jgi:hypothetical protein
MIPAELAEYAENNLRVSARSAGNFEIRSKILLKAPIVFIEIADAGFE